MSYCEAVFSTLVIASLLNVPAPLLALVLLLLYAILRGKRKGG